MQNNNLSKKHKIAAGALVVFGIFVIVMWVMQFKQNITAPFGYKKSDNKENSEAVCAGPECGGNEEDLRFKDSDKDGLSDWDELNVYNTSPYLEDSDSDGFTDKAEIDKGSDPNCPEGKNCYETAAKEPLKARESDTDKDINKQDQSQTNQNDLLNNSLNQNTGNGLDSSTGQEQMLKNIMSGQSDPATLRKTLLEFGMDKATLDKISDEDLVKSYQEVLSKTGEN